MSFLGAIWAFSGVMSGAMAALDRIDEIPSDRTRPFWKAKLISLALSIGTIILLILASGVVFVSDLIVQAIARQSCLLESVANCDLTDVQNCLLLADNCPLESQLLGVWRRWRWPISLGIVSLAFAFVYRYGPAAVNQIFLFCRELFLLLFCGRYFQLYFGFMFCTWAITLGLTARSELLLCCCCGSIFLLW